MEKTTNIGAIREFFGEGRHGRKVEMSEMKDLSQEERKELGALCAEELGREIEK